MRQTVTPYLLYEDAGAALEWLSNAFEFTETERIENPDGTVGHAEMDVGDGSTIFLGSPGEGYQNPRSAGRTALVYVYVEDVDEHYAQAKEAGAEIVEEPAEQPYGDRRYAAEDPEGHLWYFAAPLARS
jgi:uncharacterized glyoxalase superfamily protein PhnB